MDIPYFDPYIDNYIESVLSCFKWWHQIQHNARFLKLKVHWVETSFINTILWERKNYDIKWLFKYVHKHYILTRFSKVISDVNTLFQASSVCLVEGDEETGENRMRASTVSLTTVDICHSSFGTISDDIISGRMS